MSDQLEIGIVGFDITPKFHPRWGAWGTTPSMTKLDLPLLARCVAIQQGPTRVLWYGADLVGDPPKETNALRDEVASALGLTREQVIWCTSQTHSSGAVPGSKLTGSSITSVVNDDRQFADAERARLINSFIEAGRAALDCRQPASISTGRGYCDSMSYNTRFPMPTGGVKFSRHHAEGLQGGKFYDPTIGLVRFDDAQGRPLGAIFNFCSHPATMINGEWISPDWVGTARAHLEEALGGAPAMFVQGMCGDVNCRHIFGTPAQAKQNGNKLGQAMIQALPTLTPIRGLPVHLRWQTIDVACRPMFTAAELQSEIAARQNFIDELADDPQACWFAGINAPEFFNVQEKTAFVNLQIEYLQEGLRMLQVEELPRSSLPLTVGALRIGDLAAFLSPGENFTATGRELRQRSPFAHTLICGDTNGLFGYIGDDVEIDRGGYETNSFWMLSFLDGFRLAPAKGTVTRILLAADHLWQQLQTTQETHRETVSTKAG